jgi:hypothetical protein
MRGRQITQLAQRLAERELAHLPSLPWHDVAIALGRLLDAHSVFLELRDGRCVRADDGTAGGCEADVIGVRLTAAGAGVPAWDTEEPARDLLEQLRSRVGVEAPLLLSRDASVFVGYYVRLRASEWEQRREH